MFDRVKNTPLMRPYFGLTNESSLFSKNSGEAS